MSGVAPSSSRSPYSVGWRTSVDSMRNSSPGTTYRPPHRGSATATLVDSSLRHTDTHWDSTGERMISDLCREVHDLRQEARDRSPARERPRHKVTQSKRNMIGFPASHSPELHGSRESSPSLNPYHEAHNPRRKEYAPHKIARTGEQNAVWKELDLVSSSPYLERIDRAELPERFTAPWFDVYDGRTDPIAPPKLLEDPLSRDQKLQCSYHRDKGHMTENCHMLKTHLEQLASAGHLNEFIDSNLSEKKERSSVVTRPSTAAAASTGIINVIYDPLCSSILPGFYRDLGDVQLPHNDPLVVTLRIGNFNVKRVLIDQGSFAEVMYQDLYEKLSLGESDLTSFTSPGVSPYNAIMGREWLHRMRAVPLTLHQKLRGFMTPTNLEECEDRHRFGWRTRENFLRLLQPRALWLQRMRAVPPTLHQKLRFPTMDGVMELNEEQVTGDRQTMRSGCYQAEKLRTARGFVMPIDLEECGDRHQFGWRTRENFLRLLQPRALLSDWIKFYRS
uniref:Uncharacterized protein n=1 Tax=Fagus sylvatica TaxID=28930 RepID=A0A2N9ERE2_FAGSY